MLSLRLYLSFTNECPWDPNEPLRYHGIKVDVCWYLCTKDNKNLRIIKEENIRARKQDFHVYPNET